MLKKLLRSVSVMLTLALLFSVATCAPFSASTVEVDEPDVDLSGHGDLAATSDPGDLFGTLSGGKYTLGNQTYQLTDDVVLDGGLLVPSGTTATIDLNGYTLDRGLSIATGTNYADFIVNDGTLTITDSSGDDSGTITGGYAQRGGAVVNNGDLTIEGGTFLNNRSSQYAGAVLNNAGAILNVTGGVFKGNSDGSGGGGAFVNYGEMHFTDGTITGNIAHPNGGGIWSGTSTATLYVTGGTITGNAATGNGGGIYAREDGTIYMGGTPVVKDNTGSNVYLNGNLVINRTGAFNPGGQIDVSADNMPRAVTNDFAGTADAITFGGGHTESVVSAGEVVPYITNATHVTTWDQLKSAVNTNGAYIVLDNDITNSNKGKSIHVSDKTVTVDLMGHTVDVNRKNESSGDDYHFMYSEDDAVLTVKDSGGGGTIKNGNASNGGAFDTDTSSAALNLYNIVMADNNASDDGGAIRNRANLNMDGCILRGNSSADDGGAIMVWDDSDSCIIKNTLIYGNTSSSEGGAIYQNRSITVTIENTFIENNSATNSAGGIYVAYGTVNMTGGALIGNSGRDSVGVYIDSGKTFTANGTVFRDNSSTTNAGGAISNHGTMTLTDCILSRNTSAEKGGAVYAGNNATNTKFYDTVFENNTGVNGGAVYLYSGTVVLNGCTVKGNTAGDGGAVYIDSENDPTFQAIDTVFTGNTSTAHGGGAITAKSDVYLANCTITGNQAATNGSGIWVGDTLNVRGKTIISGNNGNNNVYLTTGKYINTFSEGLSEGSDIRFYSQGFDQNVVYNLPNKSDAEYFTLENEETADYELITSCSRISLISTRYAIYIKRLNKVSVSSWSDLQSGINNAQYETVFKLTQNLNANGASAMRIPDGQKVIIDLNGYKLNRGLTSEGSAGHVIQMKGSSELTIRDTSTEHTGMVTGGWAEHGGGINLESSSKCTIESGSVSGNHADYGGGIWNKGTLIMTGGSVSNNEANDEGGGIYNQGATISLSDCSVMSNKAKYGGGIYFDKKGDGVTQELNNVIIKSNTGSTKGGGIFLQTGTVSVTGGAISSNTSGDGGAVYVTGNTTFIAATTELKSNKSTAHSGGAIVSHATVTLTNCTIDGNKAYENGGGIWSKGTLTLTDCTIQNNKLDNGSGGGVCILDGTLNLYGGTIKKNVAPVSGGGIYYDEDADHFNMKGKVVTEDTAGSDIYIADGEKIDIVDSLLADTHIYIIVEKFTATFTNGFSTYHNGVDPATFFSTESGSAVIPDSNGEAMVVESEWSFLERIINNANSDATITLDRDWEATENDRSLVIPAGKTLTIDLNGHTIDGKKAISDSVIIVNGTLTIKDTSSDETGKITGGNAASGAAIYVSAAGTFNFQSGNISGNTATTDGGGIYNKGTLNISGGTVSNNTATSGGGVYNTDNATATISGGIITDNKSTSNGGGVWSKSTMNITGGEITGNTAGNCGGGIYNRGTLNLNGASIIENDAVKEGGGIFLQTDGTLNVKGNTVVDQNIAPIGNNILLASGRKVNLNGALASTAKLDVVTKDTSTALTSGYSTYHGSVTITYNGKTNLTELRDGELYFKNSVTGTDIDSWDALQTAINNSTSGQVFVLTADLDGANKSRINVNSKKVTIELNGHKIDRHRTSGAGNGQVIGVNGTSELTISDAAGTGTITGGYSHDGGGIWIDTNAKVTITGGAITGNTADDDGGDGGGVYNNGTLIMTGGAISFNRADDTGGGIYSTSSGTIKLQNALITGNYSDDDDGGAMNLHLKDNSSFIKNCVITNNECGDNNGGGIRLDAKDKTLTIENTRIEFNKADEKGGGIHVTNGTVDISDSYVNNNHADQGGGVYLENKCKLTAEDTEFNHNESDDDGAGIYCYSEMTLTNCSVNNNESGDFAGGINIHSQNSMPVTLNNCEVNDNVSFDGGGGISMEGQSLVINGGSVNNNEARQGWGGGIRVGSYMIKDTEEDFTLIADGVDISGNIAGSEKHKRNTFCGGGIHLKYGRVKVLNCTINENHGKYDGGGIEVTDNSMFNEMFVENTTFNANEAGVHGTAIHVQDDGRLHLKDVTVTGNNKDHAVWVNEDLYVSGKIVIEGNDETDLFLNDDEPIVLEGPLSASSHIGVELEDKTGKFTKNFHKYHPNEDPSDYFFANTEGYSIAADKNGEGKVISTDWVDLQRAIDDVANSGTVQLTKSYTGDDSDATLIVPANKTITLDLNGFTIDGAGEVGTLIKVNSGGQLTIKDSGITGTITGGTHSAIENYGTLILQSGTITGNSASTKGGGVDNQGVMMINGGTITGNTSANGGGIYNAGTLKLFGGRIEKNNADMGGGIYNAGTLQTKNAPYVKDNFAAAGNNILLTNNKVVTITGALTTGAKLDVATKNYTAALTNGYSSYTVAANTFSYNENANITLQLKSSELYYPDSKVPSADKWVNSWTALQDAINNDAYQGKTIGLSGDLTPDGQMRIVVDNKQVTIELAGHTINRGRTSDTNQGNVFKVTGDNGDLTVKDTIETGIITGGYADGDGGGFYVVDGAKLTIQGGSVIGNKATSDGAGIYVDDAALVMTGGAVSGNYSEDNGGGIYTSSSATITLSNAKITGNASENGGGGLNIHLKSDATFTNCIISNNESEDSDGGGFSLNASDKTLYLNSCTISGNIADDEGGGIYIDHGTVNMSGGKIDGNTAEDGGGVYITGGDKLKLSNDAVVSNNETTDKSGGGITCHGKLEINSATVEKNHSAKYGGGIFYQNSDTEITLTDADIKDNIADNDGGGIYIKQGTLTLSGGSVSGNTSIDGGGIFVTDDTKFNADGTTISDNTVTEEDGGGIVNRGTTTLTNVSITGNEANENGGGIWNDDTISLTGCTLSDNVAVLGNGGGIAHVDGHVYLTGTNTITENNAAIYGSGIYVDEEANDIKIQDTLTVNENYGSNVYLDEEYLTLSGKLQTASKISVTTEDEVGKFTKKFREYNTTGEPNVIFLSDDQFEIYLLDGEAAMRYVAAEEHPFVSMYDNVADYDKVTGKNWMSAVSGERYLYEINLPRAHDSAMNKVSANLSSSDVSMGLAGGGIPLAAIGVGLCLAVIATLATGGAASPVLLGFAFGTALLGTAALTIETIFLNKCKTNAKTQYRYIDELMEDGVREFDIRLNNKNYKGGGDDGDNLFLCHGKSNVGGTYQGCDHDGDPLTLDTVLTWAKEFLKKHPTEVIEFTFSVETTTADKDEPIINNRLRNILKKLSREINPSTGKPYLYMKDGVFNKQYDVPQLKDCRGQIICGRLCKYSQYPYMQWDANLGRYGVAITGVINLPENFIGLTLEGFRQYPSPMVLTDALTHRTYWSGYFLNTTDDENKLLLTRTPLDLEQDIKYGFDDIEGLFVKGGEFNQQGKFFGRLGMDGISRSDARIAYFSNFYSGLQYRTITVRSGLPNDDTVKTYKVLKGTKITIPGCIYEDYDPNTVGYFQNWSVTTGNNGDRSPDYAIQPDNPNREWLEEHTYTVSTDDAIVLDANSTATLNPNDVLCVMDDIEVTATWAQAPKSSVNVVWMDAEDADGIRPEALKLSYTLTGETETREVNVFNDTWSTMISGTIAAITPTGDQIGVDEAIGYRYTVTGSVGTGFTVTMYHAPQATITAAGTIFWDDDDNADEHRPDSVTIHLIKTVDGEDSEIDSATATSANGWAYSFGSLAAYENYEEVVYTVVADEVDYYSSSANGFNITNVYYPPEIEGVKVNVEWKDDFDASGKRPESVSITLMNGNDVVDTQTVYTREDSDYGMVLFDVSHYEEENPAATFNYTVVQEGLPASYTEDISNEDGEWYVRNTLTQLGYFRDHALSLDGDIGVNFNLALSAQELSTASVTFAWGDKELTVDSDDFTYDSETGFYVVKCPVAPAEISEDITATLAIDGDEVETNVYSVSKCTYVILSSSEYHDEFVDNLIQQTGDEVAAEAEYSKLVEYVLTLVDYCSTAQIVFNTNLDNIANGTKSSLFNDEVRIVTRGTALSEMNHDLDGFGLAYKYSTAVSLTTTSLRHYYRITDPDAFNAIKGDVTFDGQSAAPVTSGDLVYFELQGITANQLDKQYVLNIGGSEYSYSVMDYASNVIGSDADKKTVELAKALSRFNTSAKELSDTEAPAVALGDSVLLGDADGDGSVTILDATAIQKWLADLAVSVFDPDAADIGGSGVDVIDATRVQRYLVDIDDNFHIGEYISKNAQTPDEYVMPIIT